MAERSCQECGCEPSPARYGVCECDCHPWDEQRKDESGAVEQDDEECGFCWNGQLDGDDCPYCHGLGFVE